MYDKFSLHTKGEKMSFYYLIASFLTSLKKSLLTYSIWEYLDRQGIAQERDLQIVTL